jgi:hypothetical protein
MPNYSTSLDHVTMGCGTPEAEHPMTTSSPSCTSNRPSSGMGITDGGSESATWIPQDLHKPFIHLELCQMLISRETHRKNTVQRAYKLNFWFGDCRQNNYIRHVLAMSFPVGSKFFHSSQSILYILIY